MTLTWTDERIEILRTMAPSGASASEIAEAIGGGLSRSSVISAAHRYGIDISNGRPGHHARKPFTPEEDQVLLDLYVTHGVKWCLANLPDREIHHVRWRAEKLGLVRRRVPFPKRKLSGKRPADPGVICASGEDIPANQRRSILTVANGECRWPFGDPGNPDFFLCGAPTEEECSYCASHMRLAFDHTATTRARATYEARDASMVRTPIPGTGHKFAEV